MKTAFMKKILSIGLVTLVASVFLLGASAVNAAETQKNLKLYSSSDKTSSSVVLSFKYKKFRGEKVNLIVSIRKKGSGKLTEKEYSTTLNDKGMGSVTVKGLDSGTKYKFKVKMKRVNDGTKYTKNSNTKTIKTL